MINTNNNINSFLLYNFNNVNNANNMFNLLNANQSFRSGNNANSLSQSAQDFIVGARNRSEVLRTAMQELTGRNSTNTSVFDQMTAISSNTEALTIRSFDQSRSNNFSDINVNIQQVATTQRNEGTALSAVGRSFNTGAYRFEIEVGGRTHQFSLNITASDTNQTIQQRMAESINSRNIGVTASVNFDSGRTSLNLESINTGVADDGGARFTVRDLSGDLAARTGIVNQTRQAQNAIYSINGGPLRESRTNNVDLGNGVQATLRQATVSDVTISMGIDNRAAINRVREMVNGFNGLLAAAEENSGDRRTDSLVTALRGIINTYLPGLERIGISFNEHGYLTINENRMNEAAENGNLRSFFGAEGRNANFGFSFRMSRIAERVYQDPTAFVSNVNNSGGGNNSSGPNSPLNHMQTMRMNQLLNIGLLFDFMM